MEILMVEMMEAAPGMRLMAGKTRLGREIKLEPVLGRVLYKTQSV